jgi:hypothetical protein
MKKLGLAFAVAATIASAVSAAAQGYPTPKEGDWVARDFRFHTGEVVPELRIHYTTVGDMLCGEASPAYYSRSHRSQRWRRKQTMLKKLCTLVGCVRHLGERC